MAYDVLKVSQYVVNYSIQQGMAVTNLKLQKILYYIQAAFLIEYNEPCFNERIEHWRHGPVVPTVYSKFKSFLDKEIDILQDEINELCIDKNGELAVKVIRYNEDDFYIEDISLMNDIIECYRNITPWEMVTRTHSERPWQNTGPNEIITHELIKDYFDYNRERIYGGA